MPFNAKVKGTSNLFEALTDASSSRAVDALEEGTSYWGFLYIGQFDAGVDAVGSVIFRCAEERKQAKFQAEELEQVLIPLRIKSKQLEQ